MEYSLFMTPLIRLSSIKTLIKFYQSNTGECRVTKIIKEAIEFNRKNKSLLIGPSIIQPCVMSVLGLYRFNLY
jgi:hypothetical protein